jgi:hypothetical protein
VDCHPEKDWEKNAKDNPTNEVGYPTGSLKVHVFTKVYFFYITIIIHAKNIG